MNFFASVLLLFPLAILCAGLNIGSVVITGQRLLAKVAHPRKAPRWNLINRR